MGVPLGVLAVVLAVLFGERMSIDHELLLVVPPAVAPGGTLPARALVFHAFDQPGGPRLTGAEVELRLVDPSGRVRARQRLAPSPAGGAEGTLEVPSGLRGAFAVHALAEIDGEPVASVRTPIELQGDPEPAPSLGRLATELQHLTLGPVQGSAPPAPFDVRVVSGACVPEEPCEILVHVGEPAAQVRLAPAASVTTAPPVEDETRGVVSLPVVVHGPEARTELIASRSGVEVGRRSVQIPVALATPSLGPGPRVLAEGEVATLDVRVLGEPLGVIADVYRGGVWTRTVSLLPGRSAPIGVLPPGLSRVQVRADAYSSDRAAVRTFLVSERGESAARALERAGIADLPDTSPELRLAWATAREEEAVFALPARVSGRAADEARLEARRSTLRIAALVALALGLVIAAVAFSRRGVGAALEAQRIMDATGDPALASARHRRRTLASALILVLTLLLALLGAATLVVARAHLLS